MMKKLHIFADFGKFIKEFFLFLKKRKRWWLAPLLVLLVLLALLVFISEISVIAPFIYTLF
jgi:hypothetical protein